MPQTYELPQDVEEVLDHFVRTGRFASREEALRAGLGLLVREEERIAAVDDLLNEAIADRDNGNVAPLADVFDDLERRLEARLRR
jgi:putative addiction module CopG family antidote